MPASLGKSSAKAVDVGINTAVVSPSSISDKAAKDSMAKAAAKARGHFRLVKKSTMGVSRSCNKSDKKMMNANDGNNQNADNKTENATANNMEVR